MMLVRGVAGCPRMGGKARICARLCRCRSIRLALRVYFGKASIRRANSAAGGLAPHKNVHKIFGAVPCIRPSIPFLTGNHEALIS